MLIDSEHLPPGNYIARATYYPESELGGLIDTYPCVNFCVTTEHFDYHTLLQITSISGRSSTGEHRRLQRVRIAKDNIQELSLLVRSPLGYWLADRVHPDWPETKSLYFVRGEERLNLHQIQPAPPA